MSPVRKVFSSALAVSGIIAVCSLATATGSQALREPNELYAELKAFRLSGNISQVDDLVIAKDRVELSFSGSFFFQEPIDGRVYGAVFIGEGRFRTEAGPDTFERDHVRRLLGTETIESDFSTAVLRFTDDTYDLIGPGRPGSGDLERAERLADEFGPRLLEETGANLASRLAVSVLHGEDPGFFVAEFDGGDRDRFTFLLDPQSRIPAMNFRINAGEKGLVFAHDRNLVEVWTAFYSQNDYERGVAAYADSFDLVDVSHYDMKIDLTDRGEHLAYEATLDVSATADLVRAFPMSVSESLPESLDVRKNKGMRLLSCRTADGTPVEFAQEDWEGGFTLFLPEPLRRGDTVTIVMELAGDFMTGEYRTYYPRVASEWYPRHGYLDSATFDLTFLHHKDDVVAAAGLPLGEEGIEDSDDVRVSRFQIDYPVPLTAFAVGYLRHYQDDEFEVAGQLIDFASIQGRQLKEDFVLAEMWNSIQYFTDLFGPYPYPIFAGVERPVTYGQGFASFLLLPPADRSERQTFSFIAHETSHQWWGNLVRWRSYRDQWLSEGFAEYSGVLYTELRDGNSAARDLINQMRRALLDPPRTDTGIGEGRLADIGPITLGHRLNSTKTLGAYQQLIYDKGGLVLRMLHFLLSDPGTGDDTIFFDMMKDFVSRNSNGLASTETFREVANEHFARTRIAATVGVTNLDWFFREWVYEAYLPSYRMEYELEDQPDGSVRVTGTVFQDDVPDYFFMPLPVVVRFDGDAVGRLAIYANGPESPFAFRLPAEPDKIELDPDKWVLSEETTERER